MGRRRGSLCPSQIRKNRAIVAIPLGRCHAIDADRQCLSAVLDRPRKNERGRRDNKVRLCEKTRACRNGRSVNIHQLRLSAIIIAVNQAFNGSLVRLAGGII